MKMMDAITLNGGLKMPLKRLVTVRIAKEGVKFW